MSIAALPLALLAIASASGAADREVPVRYAPSTPWQVDYAEDSCRLARRFGEGDQSIVLMIDRFRPGDHFRMTLAGKPLESVRPRQAVKVRFGPKEREQELQFYEGRVGELPALLFEKAMRIAPLTEEQESLRAQLERSGRAHMFEAPTLDATRAEEVEYLHVAARGSTPKVLETGSLGNAFAALHGCTEELLTHWGIDVEKHRTLSRKPVPAGSPGTWLRPSDYPPEMIRRGAQAIVHFRLIVDPDGRVSECRIQQATQGEAFSEAVCNAFRRRARFEPALDAEGVPIKSYYSTTAIFRIG